MEHFPNPLDLFNAFTRLRAHGKHLQRPGDTLEVIGWALYLHMKTDQSDLLASRYAPQCSTGLLPKSIRTRKKKKAILGCFLSCALKKKKYSVLCGFFVPISVASMLTFVAAAAEYFQVIAAAFTLGLVSASFQASRLAIERGPLIPQHVYWRLPRWTS